MLIFVGLSEKRYFNFWEIFDILTPWHFLKLLSLVVKTTQTFFHINLKKFDLPNFLRFYLKIISTHFYIFLSNYYVVIY
jgi:hypothetical protein